MKKFSYILLTTLLFLNSFESKSQNDDDDRDGVKNSLDNCQTEWNPIQRDDDGDGIGDICDNKYIVTSIDENAPIGYVHDLSELLPNDATNLQLISGNDNNVFSVSQLGLKLEKTLRFNDKNIYKLNISYNSAENIKPSGIVLYVNFVLPNVSVEAIKTESANLLDGFERYDIYDPFLELIDENKRGMMWDAQFSFGSFYGNGPAEEMALHYDLNKDGLDDLVFGSGRINYNGYIFGGGHMGGSPLYAINKGNFKFDLKVNSFENKSIQHSITYVNYVDLDGDSIPEIPNFGEHYHIDINTHNPYYKLQTKWMKSKNIIKDVHYDEVDFKKIRYFKISANNELIDMSNKISGDDGCFYSIYQNGYGDIDNDGDMDLVFGGQVSWINNGCGVNGRRLGILRNDGNGNFNVEWVGANGVDFNTSEGHLLLEDISGDGYIDIIFNGNNHIKYILNDGQGSFIYNFENNIDVSVEGMRNIFIDDLDNDQKKEIIIFNTNGFGSGGSSSLKNFVKIYNYDNNLNFNEVSDKFFSNNENIMDFYSQETWMRYIDIDYDGHKDLVPKFSLEDPKEPGNIWNYPTNAYTKDWNDSKGFQYFKFNPTTKKFEIINIGVVDLIPNGNSNCELFVNYYNRYDFYDLDGDGIDEWLTFGWPGPYETGSSLCAKLSVIIYKLVDSDLDGLPDLFDPRPKVTLSVDKTSVAENQEKSTLYATLSKSHTKDVTVKLKVSGTATADQVDYFYSSDSLTIKSNDSIATLDFMIVQDQEDEQEETIIIEIDTIIHGVEDGNQKVTITIQDDDSPVTTGIESSKIIEKIYPNPTKNNLTIQLKEDKKIRKIEFVDFSGRIVQPNKISRKKNQIKVNVSNLDKGIYILNLASDKEVYKVKVIVE